MYCAEVQGNSENYTPIYTYLMDNLTQYWTELTRKSCAKEIVRLWVFCPQNKI